MTRSIGGESVLPVERHAAVERTCTTVTQPDFTGQEAFYNSGWLNSKQKFTVHLSSAITPASSLHVRAPSRRNDGEDRRRTVEHFGGESGHPVAAGQRTLAAIQAKLVPAVNALHQGKPPIR